MNVTVLVPSTLRAAVDGKHKLDLGVPAGAGVGEVLQTLLTLYPKLRAAMANETKPRRQQRQLEPGARLARGRADLALRGAGRDRACGRGAIGAASLRR